MVYVKMYLSMDWKNRIKPKMIKRDNVTTLSGSLYSSLIISQHICWDISLHIDTFLLFNIIWQLLHLYFSFGINYIW